MDNNNLSEVIAIKVDRIALSAKTENNTLRKVDRIALSPKTENEILLIDDQNNTSYILKNINKTNTEFINELKSIANLNVQISSDKKGDLWYTYTIDEHYVNPEFYSLEKYSTLEPIYNINNIKLNSMHFII